MKSTVAILGSCVSRDLFEICGDTQFQLVDYLARSSIISLVSEPEAHHDLSSIMSGFQRKMVAADFSKAFWYRHTFDDADILLLDLIDERFDIITTEVGFVTASPEFSNGKLFVDKKYRRVRAQSPERLAKWAYCAEMFVQGLEELNRVDTLVLNEVYWAEKDDQGQALLSPFYPDRIRNANAELKFMYAWFHERVPTLKSLNYEIGLFTASVKHRWGISPFHFCDGLYKDAHQQLVAIKHGGC